MSGDIRGGAAVRRIAARKLGQNRAQSWVAGCAIVLTTLLLTAIFTLGASLNRSMELAAMKTSGSDYHGSFKNLTEEQARRLAEDPAIRESSRTVYIGRLQDGPLADSALEVVAAGDDYPRHAFVRFEKGGMPHSADEIALSGWALDALGAPREPGTPLELSVTLDDGTLLKRTFRLSGWYEADRYLPGAGGAVGGIAYVSPAFAKLEAANYDPASAAAGKLTGSSKLYVMFGGSRNIEEHLLAVRERTGISADYGVNWAYSADRLWQKPLDLLPYAALLLIVMLSGYLLIYNVFHIAVVRDVKFYGLLKTIGTPPRQIRRLVAAQCNRLYLLALAPGLLLGYAAGALLTPYVSSLASGVEEPAYSANPFIFAGAALFAYVTVRLSAGRPARTASAVSPVEAAKYSGLPPSRRVRSGTGGGKPIRMSWRNLARRPRRLAIMLGSLSLSLILFSIVYNVIGSVSTDKYLDDYIAGDWMVRDEGSSGEEQSRATGSSSETSGPPLTPEIAERLAGLPGIASADRVYWTYVEIPVEASIRAGYEMRQRSDGDGDSDSPTSDAPVSAQVRAQMHGLGSGLYDLLKPGDIAEGAFDPAKFESGGYVLVTEATLGDERYASYYRPGDRIALPGSDQVYEVMAVLRYNALYAIGSRFFTPDGFNLYLPEKAMTSAFPDARILSLALNADEASGGARSGTDAALRAATAEIPGLSVRSRDDYRQELTGFLSVFRLVGYSLCGIVALIGLLNYANTVLTGVIARRRELAAMESVGMTRRQLRRLLLAEGVWVVALTAGAVLSVGTLCTYAVVRFLTANMAFTVFRLNMLPTAALLLLLLAAAYGISRSACRMLSVQSITDRLRESV